MLHALFICGKARLRSPTAEQLFSTWPDVETASAGINHDADSPVTPELLDWADIIFVMEQPHRTKLAARFQPSLKNKRIIVLNIPDEYALMDPRLIGLLTERVSRHLQ
jgi:predicted protein tyrosine phosphatase